MIRRHGARKRCACGASMAGQRATTLYCPPCAREARRASNRRSDRARRAGVKRERAPHPRRLPTLTVALIAETRARLGWSYERIAADFGVSIRTAWRYVRSASPSRTQEQAA